MKVEIYGAPWCTFCKDAVKLCEAMNVSFQYFDVDNTPVLKELEGRIGAKVRTIPQIFVDGDRLPDGFTSLRAKLVNI